MVDSNGDDMWSTAGSYSTIAASVGDVLRFKYSTSHDVYKMADYTAYDECLSAYSTELGTNSVGGGSGSLSNQYDYTVTAEDLAAGTIYFACSYYPWYSFDHCVEGQKFAVTVTAAATTPAPRGDVDSAGARAAPRAALVGAPWPRSALAVGGAFRAHERRTPPLSTTELARVRSPASGGDVAARS